MTGNNQVGQWPAVTWKLHCTIAKRSSDYAMVTVGDAPRRAVTQRNSDNGNSISLFTKHRDVGVITGASGGVTRRGRGRGKYSKGTPGMRPG